MCPPKQPQASSTPVVTQAETPIYGTAPEPEVAPQLADDPTKTAKNETASIRAKRKGIGALRTDLGIPDKQNAGSGLQIKA